MNYAHFGEVGKDNKSRNKISQFEREVKTVIGCHMPRDSMTFQRNDPILSKDSDRLGFGALAKQLADISNPTDDRDSLIIGVEGQWGSGKSSLLQMTKSEIQEKFEDECIVVEFAPWLVGSRDDLLGQFFAGIVTAINEKSAGQGDLRGITKEASSNAVEALQDFGRSIAPLAGLARLAGDFGLPLVGMAAGPLSAFGEASKAKTNEPSLVSKKREVAKLIKRLDRRFIVLIDDIDRLEPTEIGEIFRLVRAVLDLEEFTYIISYDKKIVWNALSKEFGPTESRKYLEKIVRVEVKLPKPETSALAEMFRSSLIAIVGGLKPDEEGEIDYIFQTWGRRYLETPRSIIRVCDNIAFIKSGARFDLYLPDLVLISILKVGSPDYYDFIEDYISVWAYRIHSGGQLAIGESEQFQTKFEKIAESDSFDIDMEFILIGRHLPGIAAFLSGDQKSRFLAGRHEDSNAIARRRLAAADYGRAYFALQPPSIVPDETKISAFEELLKSPDSQTIAAGILDQISHGQSADFLPLLDRVKTRFTSDADQERLMYPLFTALCSVGTAVYEFERSESWHRPHVWNSFRSMLASGVTIENHVEFRRAVDLVEDPSWICDLVGHEYDTKRRGNDNDRVFSDDALEWITHALIRRLSELKVPEISTAARPDSIWFFWLFRDKEEFADFLRKRTRKNVDLLEFLRSFWTRSSGAKYYIEKESLSEILDTDKLEDRMLRLTRRKDELGLEAREVATKLIGWGNASFGEDG